MKPPFDHPAVLHAKSARRARAANFALHYAEALIRRGFDVLRVDLRGLQPRIDLSPATPPTAREHRGDIAYNHLTAHSRRQQYNRHGVLITVQEGTAP